MVRRPSRRWLRCGLALGALGVVAYARYRSRDDPTAAGRQGITERHAAAFLVNRRIEPGREATVSDHVERTFTGADPRQLLGLEGASTASLFLDRRGGVSELVWYVEVPRPVLERWDDPESTVADAFPVTHDALESTHEPIDRTLLVHAANPTRPRTIASDGERGSRSIAVLADDVAATVDVELVPMRLGSGVPERLADWFERLSRRVIEGDLDLGWVESESAAMLEAERMYTESIVLERDDAYTLYLYMEAEDMQRVYDAFTGTWNPVARASELLLGWALRNPGQLVEYPLETDVECLAHAVHPNRPRLAGECVERNW